jgi:hypothetical protein
MVRSVTGVCSKETACVVMETASSDVQVLVGIATIIFLGFEVNSVTNDALFCDSLYQPYTYYDNPFLTAVF